jgi:NitT/TauT family transport system ATP-binding protein
MALSIDEIAHHFGTLSVLEEVSFQIDEGEFSCLIGPSGCGKTTLLKIMANLLPASAGRILFNESRIQCERGDIGYVFQENALFPWLTVRENVEFGLEIHGSNKEKRKALVDKYLQLVGLQEFWNYYPNALSGGMKQRLAMARALVYQPRILLMDEPFVSLDAQTRNFLQEELLEIWSREKKSIIFVTHNYDEAVFLADRIVVLTARPARVKEIINVDIPRPRKRTSPENNRIRDKLYEIIAEEIAKDRIKPSGAKNAF